MQQLRLAQIVVSEGTRSSLLSRGIAYCTGSWATHVFMAGWGTGGIEAWFPKVRLMNVNERVERLQQEDRAFAVLDIPTLTFKQRAAAVTKAMSYVGRYYDVGQVALFALTGKFWHDGPRTLMCSRLITSAYYSGAKVDVFDDATLGTHYPITFPRLANLRHGYAVPADLLNCRLEVVDFVPSSRITSLEQFQRGGNP